MRTISLLLLLLSLTFCRQETLEFEIAIAFPSDPPSLDPLFATDLVSQKISKFIFAGLYHFKDNILLPNLAESETLKRVGNLKIMEISLKKIEGLSSEDVFFSLDRLMNGDSPRKGDYAGIRNFHIVNNHTIRLSLDSSVSENEIKEKLALPFAAIIRKKDYVHHQIFSSFGPYFVQDWKKNEYLILEKRKENTSLLPKSILIRILPQSTTSLFLYKKNQIDAFKLTDFLLSLPEADEKHTILKRGRSVQYIAINHTNPCFDKNFRYALNFAVPRELIISKLLGKKADEVVGPIPKPFFDLMFKKERRPIFSYDPTLAKHFLSISECYPAILATKLEFRMRGDDENQAKGRAIVQALVDIGLKVKIKGMEKAPLYKENGEGKGDLTLLTWYSDYPSLWNFLDPLFHASKVGNGGNRAFYIDDQITNLLEKKDNLASALSVIEKIEIDAPWIFLWSIQENYLVSDKFIRYPELSDFL